MEEFFGAVKYLKLLFSPTKNAASSAKNISEIKKNNPVVEKKKPSIMDRIKNSAAIKKVSAVLNDFGDKVVNSKIIQAINKSPTFEKVKKIVTAPAFMKVMTAIAITASLISPAVVVTGPVIAMAAIGYGATKLQQISETNEYIKKERKKAEVNYISDFHKSEEVLNANKNVAKKLGISFSHTELEQTPSLDKEGKSLKRTFKNFFKAAVGIVKPITKAILTVNPVRVGVAVASAVLFGSSKITNALKEETYKSAIRDSIVNAKKVMPKYNKVSDLAEISLDRKVEALSLAIILEKYPTLNAENISPTQKNEFTEIKSALRKNLLEEQGEIYSKESINNLSSTVKSWAKASLEASITKQDNEYEVIMNSTEFKKLNGTLSERVDRIKLDIAFTDVGGNGVDKPIESKNFLNEFRQNRAATLVVNTVEDDKNELLSDKKSPEGMDKDSTKNNIDIDAFLSDTPKNPKTDSRPRAATTISPNTPNHNETNKNLSSQVGADTNTRKTIIRKPVNTVFETRGNHQHNVAPITTNIKRDVNKGNSR